MPEVGPIYLTLEADSVKSIGYLKLLFDDFLQNPDRLGLCSKVAFYKNLLRR